MIELKPCPFCGGAAKLTEPNFSRHNDACDYFKISCDRECEIVMSRMVLRDCGLDELTLTRDALAFNWNLRFRDKTPVDLTTVAWRFRHSADENWHFGESPQNWWEKQQLVERAEAENAILEARAERDEARAAEEEAKDCFWSIYETYLEKGGIPVSTVGARSALANRMSALQSDNAALTNRIAQLTEEVAMLSSSATRKSADLASEEMAKSVHQELNKVGLDHISPNDLRTILKVALRQL